MPIYDSISKTYTEPVKTDPVDRLSVEIGDSKQIGTFYPQVKVMRWDNEVNFSARLVNDELTPVLSDSLGIIKWEGSAIDCRFYSIQDTEHPQGAYEFNVILKEIPKSNIITFTIQTKGLDYFYQPKLTEEEIKRGCLRPDNVVGSYAVYYQGNFTNYEGGKLYRSGKAFHIYRPGIIDAVGSKVWGELNIDIDKGLLTVTIPQEFLDKATYPIQHSAGLTLGYSTIGGSTDTPAAGNFIAAGAYQSAAGGGTISKCQVAAWSVNSDPLRMALYVNSGDAPYGAGAVPGALLANSDSGAMTVSRTTKPTQDSEFTSSVVPNGTIVSSTYYWICFNNNNTNTMSVAFDAGGAYSYWYKADAYANFPDANAPASMTNSNAKYSAYYTYAAAGGGAIPLSNPFSRPFNQSLGRAL
jgi:hypothetical protein